MSAWETALTVTVAGVGARRRGIHSGGINRAMRGVASGHAVYLPTNRGIRRTRYQSDKFCVAEGCSEALSGFSETLRFADLYCWTYVCTAKTQQNATAKTAKDERYRKFT